MDNHTEMKILNEFGIRAKKAINHLNIIIQTPSRASSLLWLEALVYLGIFIAFIFLVIKRKDFLKKSLFTLIAIISISYLQFFTLLIYLLYSVQSTSLLNIFNWLREEIEFKLYKYKQEHELIKHYYKESELKIKLQSIIVKIFGIRAPNLFLF